MISFGDFRLDRRTRKLRYRGNECRLRAKSSAVLLYLAEHPNRLVTRAELLSDVWPDTSVRPTVLRVCIREIRVALGGEADRFLTTVPRRGYRFVIEPGEEGATTPRFVGRDAEMAALHEALASARSGSREVVFVTGEAGSGKTALVEHFLDEVRADGGIRCGRGQSIELHGRADGCAAILDLLNGLCEDVDGGDVLDGLFEWAPGWLLQLPSRIDEETAKRLSERHTNPSWEGRLLELRQALHQLAGARPLILVHDAFGPDLDAGTLITEAADKDAAKCQAQVWKAVTKCEQRKLKEFVTCKKVGLKDETIVDGAGLETVCLTQAGDPTTGQPDEKGKIAKACTAAEKGIGRALTKHCEGQDTGALFPGCALSGDPAVCLDQRVECRVCLAINDADGTSRLRLRPLFSFSPICFFERTLV